VNIVEPPQTGERRILVKKDVATPYMMIGYKTPDSKNEDYYALNILSSVLSSGNSSRLYAALVDQKQLATEVFTNFGDTFDPNLFNVYAVANKDVKDIDLEQAIYIEIEKIKNDTTNNQIIAQLLEKLKIK